MSMPYRTLGRTGEKVSILGFGCMRLPLVGERPDQIDKPVAAQMLHYAIEHGVNYLDTAYPYHGASFDGTPGTSEAFVGEALAGGYRERVLVATKQPGWMVKSRADMESILAGQLERLRVGAIDCYLLHGMDAAEFERLTELGVLDFLDDAKAAGKIRYAGFSYHDEAPAFAPIVDAYHWDFCQIQYNFMDTDFQAGTAGLAYAAGKGLGVVVMEPLKGGRLAGKVPAPVQDLWDEAPVRRSASEWALRFVWNDPRVSLVLSGMSTTDQVVGNVESAGRGEAGSLGQAELDVIDQVRRAYQERTVVECTACRYCMPCPQGINIPMIFSCLNNVSFFDSHITEQRTYDIELKIGHTAPASACTECGQCEAACPQQIMVSQELKAAVRAFEA